MFPKGKFTRQDLYIWIVFVLCLFGPLIIVLLNRGH
jgi:hypothetical protein